MKKHHIILCALVAASGIVYASSEKLTLRNGSDKVAAVQVENINSISYSGDEDGFKKMNILFNDETTKTFDLDEFSHMEYTPSLGESAVDVKLHVHQYAAEVEVTVKTADVETKAEAEETPIYWRVVGMPQSYLSKIDEDEWADALFEADLQYIHEVADYYGFPSIEARADYIFFSGSDRIDWWADEILKGDTPIALLVYTADIKGNDITLNADPHFFTFNTKKEEITDVKFDLTADMTSTSLTLTATPAKDASDPEIPFWIDLFEADRVATYGLDALIASSVSDLEYAIYMGGRTWRDVAFVGEGSRSWSNRRAGDKWVAVAYGVEYGCVTTKPTVLEITIPEAKPTDDCTFEVTAEQESPSIFNISVTPSSNETRYVAFLVNTKSITDDVTMSKWLSDRIYYYNYTNQIIWATSDYVHTGKATLNSHDDLVQGEYLKVGESYYVAVFGIDDTGNRTTAIEQIEITPKSANASFDLTFDVKFDNWNGTNA